MGSPEILMTASELQRIVTILGWSGRELARQVGCGHNLACNWLNGQSVLPPRLSEWLRGLAAAHLSQPVPAWRG